MSRIRYDYDEKVEIKIQITDISLNEYEEVLIYPRNYMAIKWEDGVMDYLRTPEESLLLTIQGLRPHFLEMFSLKSGNMYNPDNIIRVKLLNRWRKV